MTTEQQKNALLEEFRRYLEQDKSEDVSGIDFPNLHTLLSEMAALKTEVKAESRQFKNSLDSLNKAVDTLQENNNALSEELKRHDEFLAQQRFDITRALMLELVAVYEHLISSLNVLDNYRPVNKLFNHSKKQDIRFIQTLQEGHSITLKRFKHLLNHYDVQSIDCIGKPLDPKKMNAVAVGHDPKQQNGIVLEELRPGFLFENQVLRLAEVRVNKTPSSIKRI